jgi:chromosome segregation ATPase
MEQVVTAISLDKVLDLQNKINSLTNELSSKSRELGASEAHIETLQEQITDIKDKIEEKQPEVRITTINQTADRHGFSYPEVTTQYRNLESVKDDIRKEIEAKYKKDIDNSEKTIKDLTKKLIEEKELSETSINITKSNYNRYKQEAELDYADRRLKLDKKLAERDLAITKLEEDLQKLKENKDEESIVAARDKEINDLKKQIKELKEAVKSIEKRTPLQRFLGLNKTPQILLADADQVTEWQRNTRVSIYDTLYHTWRTIVRK